MVGLSLGLTGAGGSIVTLPVLVYLASVPPAEAVAPSLFTVGAAAAAGAVQRWRRGEIHSGAAGIFAASGIAGAVLGAKLTPLIPPAWLMGVFAMLMIAVAWSMLASRGHADLQEPDCRPARCLAAGGLTGILTGLLGVGGGFLLMPAMMKFGRLPLRMATGSSLAVIAFNSAAGFLSHAGGKPLDWNLALAFAATAVIGTLLGTLAASHLPVRALRRGFAVAVLAAGVLILWQTAAA